MVKRKIPAKKHRGVNDPYRQAAERFAKIKHNIDNPPENTESQKIPYKLAQFIKLRNKVKSGKTFKLKIIDSEDKPKNCVDKIKKIKQHHAEDDVDYMKRVNRITTASLKEAEYEKKYGVDVHRNTVTGEISIKKKPKNEIDELIKEKRHGKQSNTTKINNTKPKVDAKTKMQLIKQVLQEEKQKKIKSGEGEIPEYKTDFVKFGETVHAPPTISTIPRRAQKSDTVPRPGSKSSLLLRSILNPDNNQAEAVTTENIKKSKRLKNNKKDISSNLKGKRKDLSIATRRMIETEQNKAVELYRSLKKSQQQQQKHTKT